MVQRRRTNKSAYLAVFALGIIQLRLLYITTTSDHSDDSSSDSSTFVERLASSNRRAIKIIDGKASGNPWKLVDWSNPLSLEEETLFKCTMTNFVSSATKETAPMCVHENDWVSHNIKSNGNWADCNLLPVLWNYVSKEESDADKLLFYVEIGANIGSCVMEMLLSTNANIIAFEPHPMHVFNIKKTVSLLDKSYQDRLLLFPIGLGSESAASTIYSASGNLGNSVVGKIIKDSADQIFDEKNQFTVYVERLDSILNSENVHVGLLKMDAQGFECNVIEGMGQTFINLMKFEYATNHLHAHGCLDLLPKMSNHFFDIYRKFEDDNLSGLVIDTSVFACDGGTKECDLFGKSKYN